MFPSSAHSDALGVCGSGDEDDDDDDNAGNDGNKGDNDAGNDKVHTYDNNQVRNKHTHMLAFEVDEA